MEVKKDSKKSEDEPKKTIISEETNKSGPTSAKDRATKEIKKEEKVQISKKAVAKNIEKPSVTEKPKKESSGNIKKETIESKSEDQSKKENDQDDDEEIEFSVSSDELESDESEEEKNQSPPEQNPALGLNYFFGENSVPEEVTSLLESAGNYTDELVEAEKKHPGTIKDNAELESITEENTEENTDSEASSKAESKGSPKKETGSKEPIPISSLNPLSETSKKLIKVKKTAKNLGTSYDSATLTSAIGLVDLKSLCKSFSFAIYQHIVFSKGKNTFTELQKDNAAKFTYKLGDMLKINIENQGNINIDKAKSILSDTLKGMTNTQIKPEFLTSYLTIENDDDLDLSYTQSNMGTIFAGNKDGKAEAFIDNYRNSMATFKASDEKRNTLLKTQNYHKVPIQGAKDVGKFLDTYNRNKKQEPKGFRRMSSDNLDREENEVINLDEVELPTTNKTANEHKKPVADNPFIAPSSDPVIGNETTEESLEDFSVFKLNYDFDNDQFIDLSTIPDEFLKCPSEREIYKFCKKILIYSKMEKEIPIIALIYIEKLMMKTGLLMNELNWRRFTFITLVLGSKVICYCT